MPTESRDHHSTDETTILTPSGDQPTQSAVPSTDPSIEASSAGSLGGWLPSRPASLPVDSQTTPLNPLDLGPGGRIGEFVVERVLGKGGFGVVYLARQISLDRSVALKVVAGQDGAADGEGRSLARLEHENIVQVYGEAGEPATGARLLWMQYVAGTTLATLVKETRTLAPGTWTGADLLAVLDGLGLPPVLFDPAAMRDRDFLATADHVETVCRIGEQLARALEHAHARGVLHRDVKPANVLVSRYGRPLLADFNLAIRDEGKTDSAAFGGTLAYMAPEHLDAFNPESSTLPDVVDSRSDLYSLCVVLWELSSGGRPFPVPSGDVGRDELPGMLNQLATQRRQMTPEHPPTDNRLRRTLARGLTSDPSTRYESAGRLAETLAGLREQRTAMRAFPRVDAVARWAWNHPIAAFALAVALPQLVGSALQIPYNQIRIVNGLSDPQKARFVVVALIYNVIAYPGCLTWLFMKLYRVLTVWNAVRRGEPVSEATVDEARARALRLPLDTAVAACVGWLPGAILFPLALHFGPNPVPPEKWVHFIVSFLLAGLIAVTYSLFLCTGVVVRTMYVRFWTDPRRFRERAAQELVPEPEGRRLVNLASIPDRLRLVNGAALIIPLIGAVMLLLASDAKDDATAFKILTIALILAGGTGYIIVGRLSRRYLQVVEACTGGAVRRSAKAGRMRNVTVTGRPEVESSFSPGRSSDPPSL